MTCACGHAYDEHNDGAECCATDLVAPGSFVECPCVHFEQAEADGV